MVSRPIIINSSDDFAKSVTNRHSRHAGKSFESIIDTACKYYALRHVAAIEKTPEARTVVGRTGGRNSQMICVNAKKAQPDYQGTLKNGRSVMFEAKHTDKDRIEQSRVTETQTETLDRHSKLGALCFVLVSFGGKRFFRIPWSDWKRMKELYGRKYIKAEDVGDFEVYEREVLMFLDD